MEVGNLPNQGESKPHATVLAAAGFVYTEEGLKDAPLKFIRDAAAGVGNTDQELFRLLCDRNSHPDGCI